MHRKMYVKVALKYSIWVKLYIYSHICAWISLSEIKSLF